MADDKLRQELLYMVKLTSKYDLSRMEVVEGILRLENERQILGSVFGKRFKARIFDVAAGVVTDEKCVICGQHAENKIICNHCLDTIGGSEYAKSKFKNSEEQKKKLAFPKIKLPHISISRPKFLKANEVDVKAKAKNSSGLKKGLQAILIVCLTLILFIQLWILSLWHRIPDYNPIEEARVSSNEVIPIDSQEEAYAEIEKDFPESEGYTITFSRKDTEYAGRFLLEKGACCLEIEEQLSDDERYDYFLTDEVYVFYISYLKEHTSKLGIAEINSDGAIIIEGSFNDGRRTDSFYKFR